MVSLCNALVSVIALSSCNVLQGKLQTIEPTSPLVSRVEVHSRLANLPDATLAHFDTVFAELAKEMETAIITESVPLRQTLTAKQTAALRTALKNGKKSEAVVAVSAAFDYSVYPQSTGVLVLMKRYSEDGDLPEITLQETVSGLRTFFKELNEAGYGIESYNSARTATGLKAQLTEAERKRLEEGVLVKDLRSELQPLLWSLSNVAKNASMRSLDQLYFRLKQCDDPRTVFGYGIFYGLEYPYYETKFALPNPRAKVALGWNVITGIGNIKPEIYDDKVRGVWSEGRKMFQPSTPDPTAPAKNVSVTSKESVSATTLAILVERLDGRVRSGEQTKVDTLSLQSLAVVDGLKSKRVCVFDEKSVSPYALFKAIGAVYEVPIIYAGGNATLSLPPARKIKDRSESTDELRRLLPSSYRRAIAALQARGKDNYASEKILYIPAMRRLRGLVEPKLNENREKLFPITAFDDEVRGLVALTSLTNADTLADFDALTKPYPGCLIHFPDATVKLYIGAGGNPRNVYIRTQYTDKGTGFISSIFAGTQTPLE